MTITHLKKILSDVRRFRCSPATKKRIIREINTEEQQESRRHISRLKGGVSGLRSAELEYNTKGYFRDKNDVRISHDPYYYFGLREHDRPSSRITRRYL